MPSFIEIKPVYDGWWYRMSVARIALDDGQEMERHIEDHGQAVVILPYDAGRRKVTLLRMTRAPVLLAQAPDLLEAVAGRLEEAEVVEDCGRREALEEAGLRVGALEHVSTVWSMPTLSTERLHLYLAPYSAADQIAAGGGLAEEHENITVLEMDMAQAWARAESGELCDLKTLVLLQALKLRRPELF